MDSYNAFFEYATSLGVKRFTVFPPKQGLSQARRKTASASLAFMTFHALS
jgi:hypothetical protein